MMRFLDLFRLEMRSLRLPMIVWIVAMTAVWFLVPTYMIWAIVCYVFALGGLAMKWWQCRRDYLNKNYAVLYSLPVNRQQFLAARCVAGAASGWIIYTASMIVMHVSDRFDLKWLERGPMEELAAYDEPSNYLMQFCTNRSGMFSVDIELIFRVVLAMAFFSMCIELFHIAKQNYPVVFLIYVVTNLIVRFMCIHHVEGTQVVMFLVQPLAMPITLLYYVVMATIGMRCLRNYYTGFEGKPEAIISTAGDTSF
jgi:hypothetical protein